LAWTDLSTGELATTKCSIDALSGELARLAPREVLLPVSIGGRVARDVVVDDRDDDDDVVGVDDDVDVVVDGVAPVHDVATLPMSVVSYLQRQRRILVTPRGFFVVCCIQY
jgi:hypothetical protein